MTVSLIWWENDELTVAQPFGESILGTEVEYVTDLNLIRTLSGKQ